MIASADGLAKSYRLRRAGSGYVGTCPACGYKGALSVADGDDGKTLLHCHVGCAFEDVALALGEPTFKNSAAKQSSPIRKNGASTDARNDAVRLLMARSVPATGTAVSRYLKARGIIVAPPPDVRFLPQHRHAPSRCVCPVMLGLVRNVAGQVIGVHRTFLSSGGEGKADVVPAKMTLGRIGEGAVRLHLPGADLTELAISEGIETGLSVAEAAGLPVWAALSAGGIEKLILPPLPKARQALIFADHDHHGRGQRAAEFAAERFLAEGRRVRIVLPPTVDADFNDMLREAG